MKLNRDFFLQDAYHLAQALLGKILVVHDKRYRIVETEAYGGAYDRASHSYHFTRTKRTEPLYLEGGHLYIYFIYGMYFMLNITASEKNVPEAVLIRALEPLPFSGGKLPANGPGKLCRDAGINMAFNTLDLCENNEVYIESDDFVSEDIVATKRINIDYALDDKDRLWRFYLKNNVHVSKKTC